MAGPRGLCDTSSLQGQHPQSRLSGTLPASTRPREGHKSQEAMEAGGRWGERDKHGVS